MLGRRPIAAFAAVMVLAAAASLAVADPPPAGSSSPPAQRPSAPAAASALAAEGFALLGEEHGVKVYRREKRHGIELAAEGTIPASPARVLRVLTDYPSHRRWQKHLKVNRILARGDGFLDVYQRLDLPVIDDRDFTLHVTWGDDAGVGWMRFAVANERGPGPVSGVVRVTQHEGSWRLEPAQGGAATHAVYRFYLDLAGSFPAWMGKGQATNDLPDLFVNIQNELPRYP
jgi:hypothetical protein